MCKEKKRETKVEKRDRTTEIEEGGEKERQITKGREVRREVAFTLN